METLFEKLDLAKQDSSYYKAKRQPELVDLDSYYYLTHQGKGSPGDEPFNAAIERLYSVAYNIKFLCKSEDIDFVVPKMEGIWWIDGGMEAQKNFPQTPESEWNWQIMIRMPDFVEADHFYRALKTVKVKKPGLLEDQIKFELINEGRCVQMLHIGSYREEEPTILKMMEYVDENETAVRRHHKEIYLTDPRRTPEEKLRTIIRYGVN